MRSLRFGILLASGVSLTLTSCSLLITPAEVTPHQPIVVASRATSPSTPMLVFSHGYHTGLTLPTAALAPYLPELSQSNAKQWLEFGWGDEGFYRSEEITVKLVLHALCYPTPGVLHVATFDTPPHLQYAHCPLRVLALEDDEVKAVATFLRDSFARDHQKDFISLGPGRYGQSTFYRARDSYYFPRSCNAWTARGIRAGGHRVHALTAPGVMRQLPEE